MSRLYHISRFAPQGAGRTIIRHRCDAAWLAFNRQVDDLVQANALLDRPAGVEVQLKARSWWPTEGSMTIELCGETVLIEQVA